MKNYDTSKRKKTCANRINGKALYLVGSEACQVWAPKTQFFAKAI